MSIVVPVVTGSFSDEIGMAGRPGILRIAASISAGNYVLVLGSAVTRSGFSAHDLDGYAPRETIAAALISPPACQRSPRGRFASNQSLAPVLR